MAATQIVSEKAVVNGTTNASGQFVLNISVPGFSNPSAAQQIMRLRGTVFIGTASGGLMVGAASLTFEGVYSYLGATPTLAAVAAQSGSVNPLNSNSTGEENARPECFNGTFGDATAILTVSGSNIVVTVTATIPGGGALVGATVYIKWEMDRWGIT